MAVSRSVVDDTKFLMAGLGSRRGASFRLLSEVGRDRFEIPLSVPLVLEYEDALLRHSGMTRLNQGDVDALLDYFCSVAHLQQIFYLWRPFLRDPKDDLILELAVAARCHSIVTFNRRDFAGVEKCGLSVVEPGPFLSGLGVLE